MGQAGKALGKGSKFRSENRRTKWLEVNNSKTRKLHTCVHSKVRAGRETF